MRKFSHRINICYMNFSTNLKQTILSTPNDLIILLLSIDSVDKSKKSPHVLSKVWFETLTL